jgi:hypothetical protein
MTIDERSMSDKDDNKGSIVGKREILEKALFLYRSAFTFNAAVK